MSKPDVAWIGHLPSVSSYRQALAAMRGDDLPPPRLEDVDRIVRRLAPMPICSLQVHSVAGASVDGLYIDAFILVERQGLGIRGAVRKVQAACAEAARTGAGIGTLGGFTSIVSERAALDLRQEHRIPFTTGNALTAAVVAAQVGMVAEPGCEVVVVGAAGDVGSGVCRLLHEQGLSLSLVGRQPQPVLRLAEELSGSQPLSWAEAAPRADVVVLVASTAAGEIALDGVRADAWVLDAGQPHNAAPGHPRAAVAGRVAFARHTTGGLPAFTSHACRPGEHHACMAEGAVLALEGWLEPYSMGRGRIQPDHARRILVAAQRHGITPGPLRVSAAADAETEDCET